MINADVRRELDLILFGHSFAVGELSLTTGAATSTSVTHTGMSSASIVVTQAYSANASNADIVRIVPAVDAFVVYHSASGNARTHRYVFFTGIAS
jgi:hypothetical protein